MHDHAVTLLALGQVLAAAREHVHLDALPTRFSDSLRTWRASPPSITGGYSQENVRVRIGG